MNDERKIILIPGKPPQFTGSWTVGDVLAVAESLAKWAHSLGVPATMPRQEDET